METQEQPQPAQPVRQPMSAERRLAASEKAKAAHAAKKAAATGGEGGGAAVHPRVVAERGERRRRKNMGRGSRRKLAVPQFENDPNYHYYWSADRPGRMDQLTKHDDYDLVVDPDTGAHIERHADVDKFGNPIKHHLLRKPMEYHLADEKEKANDRKRLMTAIERGKTPNADGEPIHDDGAYVPKRGIKITHGDYQP